MRGTMRRVEFRACFTALVHARCSKPMRTTRMRTCAFPICGLPLRSLHWPLRRSAAANSDRPVMDPLASPLLTDLYQLNMLEAYLANGQTEIAVFEFFFRRLPGRRGFLLAAGLEQALDYLENLRFSPEDIEWLKRTGRFSTRLIDYLAQLRFTGDVHAIAEGTVVFPNEPVVRVTAPLPQAQLVETRLINILHYQTLIASKAARAVLVAPSKLLVDFG